MTIRRELKLENLDDAMAECDRLLQGGYKCVGNWTLAQACRHLRLTIDANMNGYPTWMTVLGWPLRPFLRWFVLPRLLSGNSPGGVRTAGMFVPAEDLDDAKEVAEFEKCVAIFNDSTDLLSPHPGFGKMSRQEFNAFHAAHAAHHLSFLIPTEKQ